MVIGRRTNLTQTVATQTQIKAASGRVVQCLEVCLFFAPQNESRTLHKNQSEYVQNRWMQIQLTEYGINDLFNQNERAENFASLIDGRITTHEMEPDCGVV